MTKLSCCHQDNLIINAINTKSKKEDNMDNLYDMNALYLYRDGYRYS